MFQSRCHPARSSSSESSSAFLILLSSFSLLYSLMNFPACFLSSATSRASLHSLGIDHILIALDFELEISHSFSGRKSSLVTSVSNAWRTSKSLNRYKSICLRLHSKKLWTHLRFPSLSKPSSQTTQQIESFPCPLRLHLIWRVSPFPAYQDQRR